MIILGHRTLEPPGAGGNAKGVVEPDQPLAIRIVQCERIAQAMRPLPGRLRPLDLELDPIPALKQMPPPVEGQQELQRVVGSGAQPILW